VKPFSSRKEITESTLTVGTRIAKTTDAMRSPSVEYKELIAARPIKVLCLIRLCVMTPNLLVSIPQIFFANIKAIKTMANVIKSAFRRSRRLGSLRGATANEVNRSDGNKI
jgi:hypothetical protein